MHNSIHTNDGFTSKLIRFSTTMIFITKLLHHILLPVNSFNCFFIQFECGNFFTKNQRQENIEKTIEIFQLWLTAKWLYIKCSWGVTILVLFPLWESLAKYENKCKWLQTDLITFISMKTFIRNCLIWHTFVHSFITIELCMICETISKCFKLYVIVLVSYVSTDCSFFT